MCIVKQLDLASKEFPPSERKIAIYVSSNLSKIPELTASQLAKNANSSLSAISRFSNRMGYDNFHAFKTSLIHEVTKHNNNISLEKIEPNDSFSTIKEKLLFRIQDGVQQIFNNAEGEQFDQVVDLFKTSGSIFVFGVKNSSITSNHLFQRFVPIGVNVIYNQDPHFLASRLINTKGKKVFFAISNSGERTEINALLAICKKNKIPTIGMTSKPNSTLAKNVDVILKTAKITEKKFYLRDAVLNSFTDILFIDLLYIYYSSHSYDHTADTILANEIYDAYFNNITLQREAFNDNEPTS